MTSAERLKILEAMHVLEGSPCGGVGPDGPTQADLDASAMEGHSIQDDAILHTDQQAWLILSRLAKGKA